MHTPNIEIQMKKDFTASILSFLLLASFSISPVFAQANPTPAGGEPASRTADSKDIESAVAEALTLIGDFHVDGPNLEYNSLFKSSIGQLLNALDPHSSYYDSKEAEQFRTNQSARYFGIGAVIAELTDTEGTLVGTFIRSTFEGAPAARAGLRYGDLIVEINGVSMLGKPLIEVRDTLRGPRGTTATVTVEQIATKVRRSVEITRDAVPQPSVPEAYMIRPGIGYIAMTGGFNQTTFNEFRQALALLKSEGMEKLVLDLRNNGGGLVNQAFMVANTFLGRGDVVFTQKGRVEGAANTFRSNNTVPDQTPLFVLVNGSTASASEILAGALQDNKRATIIGEETFGKGLVQNPMPLDYGSLLLLTIAKYETPSGKLIQKDYSDGSRYTYFRQPRPDEVDDLDLPKRPGGINPDVLIASEATPRARLIEQSTLVNPINNFSLELIAGKIPGMERFRYTEPIRFGQAPETDEFTIGDELLAAFKAWASKEFKISETLVERESDLIARLLRTELVTAKYGSSMSFRVFNDYDAQLLKTLEFLTR
jgi:carboxyl-terminal processing protease